MSVTSDDWYQAAYFLSLWLGVPALIATQMAYWLCMTRWKAYAVCVVIQNSLFYSYIYYVSQAPGNELGMSPAMLLVYLTIPLSIAYYGIFYFSPRSVKRKL